MTDKPLLNERTLTHLRALEAESIHIIREVAAEFDTPVMLYFQSPPGAFFRRRVLEHLDLLQDILAKVPVMLGAYRR